MDQPTWHRCTAANDGAPCVLDALHEQRDIPHLWADVTDQIAERIHNLQVSYNAANAMAGVGKRHLERLWETRKRIRALHSGPRTERYGSGCIQCGRIWPCPTVEALDQPGDQEDGTTWVRVPRAWLQIEDGHTHLTQGGHSFGPLPGDQEGTTP